jgi:excinuclease ABC subunit A
VLIDNKTIIELSSKTIEELSKFFSKLEFKNNSKEISEPITKEIVLRLEFLKKVGLGYLTLQRAANTLSGGESQRIRLASQIGSGLSGVLYVLDEPSIGLHPSDNLKLLETLTNLKNIGNTLIIVEHDFETIMSSDFVIDIGEKAGKHGGEVIFQGKPSSLLLSKQSLTGKYLSNRVTIKTPSKRRVGAQFIKIKGASENNLKNIDFEIPKGVITTVTGISGSGKSTLINDTLANFLLKKLSRKGTKIGKHKSITGYEQLDKIVIVDQSPIGRTPRSNPATYTGLFLLIRDIFAATSEAKIRGYNSGRFSFNVKAGRCQSCSGEGNITVVMNFLPDVHVTCELCKGKRYNNETLEVKYKNKSIADILEMTVTEASLLFKDNPTVYRYLKTLIEVGLGYITLGQPATTLSGGEAQRVKLASELHKKNTGNTIYIFDEPTTGLHFYDIDMLINIFHKLADHGNTLVVIEHNLDVIRNSDYIIDLGPGGGPNGGLIIATGTPEEIAANINSITGIYLKKELERLS